MTTLLPLAWLLGCAESEPTPLPTPDTARFEGLATATAAAEQLVLSVGDAPMCRWLWKIEADPDATPPCADPDGGACVIATVGWRMGGADVLGGCAVLGFTAERAGDGGLLGMGWSDDWRVAGISQGPGLAWWDGAAWVLVDSYDSSWDPTTGMLEWELPAALPE